MKKLEDTMPHHEPTYDMFQQPPPEFIPESYVSNEDSLLEDLQQTQNRYNYDSSYQIPPKKKVIS